MPRPRGRVTVDKDGDVHLDDLNERTTSKALSRCSTSSTAFKVPYDPLVVATGGTVIPATPTSPGTRPGMRMLADALLIRRKLFGEFEMAR